MFESLTIFEFQEQYPEDNQNEEASKSYNLKAFGFG
jgi:hypothetical protein